MWSRTRYSLCASLLSSVRWIYYLIWDVVGLNELVCRRHLELRELSISFTHNEGSDSTQGHLHFRIGWYHVESLPDVGVQQSWSTSFHCL